MSHPHRMPCHITGERVSNDPQDAVEDTRPDGCECRNVDEDGYDDPASDHDDTNDRCPLYECDCGHLMREHGPQGCDRERGDALVGEILQAMGPCLCGVKRAIGRPR